MIKYFIFIFFIFNIINNSFSQESIQLVKGRVIDFESKESLIGAEVKMLDNDTLISTTTDTSGEFVLNAKVGRHSFQASFMGYEDAVVSNILVTSGKEVFLNINLRENVTKIKEIEITSSKRQPINSMATVSNNRLSAEDASRYAGGMYDPSRMISSFAGVVGSVDGDLNEIVVRGNSPSGLLWRLEGSEIPNPNHFPDGQGGSGGSLSMIPSTMLSDFEFLTGAFPAEYGDATSGIMDLNLRKGNNTKHEFSFLIGDVGTQFSSEGPIMKNYKGSYLINYRYSSFSLADQMHLIDIGSYNIAPEFQDLNFNIYLPTNKCGNFELFGVGGNNMTGNAATLDTSAWKSWDDRRDEHEKHYLGIIGLKYQYSFPNHQTYLKSVVTTSTQYDYWNKGYIMQNYFRQTDQKEEYQNNYINATILINHKINSRLSLRTGLIAKEIKSDMYQDQYLWATKQTHIWVNTIGQTSLWQAYFQLKYRFNNKLEMNAGVHYSVLSLNNKDATEPRFGLKYQLSEKHIFSFGTGLYSRMQAMPVYYANTLSPDSTYPQGNKNLDFTKAFHSVIGYEFIPNSRINFKTEIYYQYLFNIPIYNDPLINISTINIPSGIPFYQMENKGYGKNYGIEFTLERSYEQNFYYLTTLSIFNSEFLAGDGKWHNTAFNSNYIFNFLIGKEFKVTHANSLGVNLKTAYRGGYRTTPVNLQSSATSDYTVYYTDKTNTQKLPDVFDLDVGVNFRKNGKKHSWVLSADLQNILNEKNIVVYEYRAATHDIVTIRGLGFIPIINLMVEL